MNNERMLKGLYDAIVACEDDRSVDLAREALAAGADPKEIIATGIEAIGRVGENYENGSVFIPELMLAGMALEKVMALAEKKILNSGGAIERRGTLVVGSVKGDVHTIGKDLVATLWRSKGYQVHDLGVDVDSARFASAAQELGADVVGLSALMSTTLPAQQEVIELFERKKIRQQCKIIVGGGVCTEAWADEIGADGFAEDAARAVALVEELLSK